MADTKYTPRASEAIQIYVDPKDTRLRAWVAKAIREWNTAAGGKLLRLVDSPKGAARIKWGHAPVLKISGEAGSETGEAQGHATPGKGATISRSNYKVWLNWAKEHNHPQTEVDKIMTSVVAHELGHVMGLSHGNIPKGGVIERTIMQGGSKVPRDLDIAHLKKHFPGRFELNPKNSLPVQQSPDETTEPLTPIILAHNSETTSFTPPPPPPSSTGSSSSSSGGASSGGSSSSGSSSSSSGGSSSKKAPTPAGSPGGKDYYTYYLAVLQGMQIPVNDKAIAFAKHAATVRWNSGEFMYFLRQQAFYHEAFPGIFRQDGTLRMSEAQYNAKFAADREVARNLGITFDRDREGFLIGKDVSTREFADRATAIHRAKENAGVLKQWSDVLMHRGLIKKPLTRPELWDALMGRAPGAFYKLWEQANLQFTAASAGLKIGLDITRKQLHKLAVANQGWQAEGDLGSNFADLAAKFRSIRQIAPEVGMHVSRKELYQLEFGGPRQATAAEKVRRIISTYQGQLQGPAQPQVIQTPQGVRTLGPKESPTTL